MPHLLGFLSGQEFGHLNVFTPRRISSSFLLTLATISPFLLIPSGLWNIVQILADKYTLLQQSQGR